jgi:hypothetical protein
MPREGVARLRRVTDQGSGCGAGAQACRRRKHGQPRSPARVQRLVKLRNYDDGVAVSRRLSLPQGEGIRRHQRLKIFELRMFN